MDDGREKKCDDWNEGNDDGGSGDGSDDGGEDDEDDVFVPVSLFFC